MEKFYKTNFRKFLFLVMGLFYTAQLYGQTYTETFDDGPDAVTSLNRTIGGTVFNFLFTGDGDGGDFAFLPNYGESNGPSLDLRSFAPNLGTTEKVLIARSDGQLFVFTSLFVRNDTGTSITVQGYKSGSPVGTSSIVATGQVITVNSGTLVDQIQLTATDFWNVNIDNFTWSVPVFSAPTVTTSAAISVDASSATLGGNVTADGGATVTARGFVYSASDATPTLGEGGVANLASGSGTGTFNVSATGLNASTTYYYQAYATNSVGTVYGGVQNFTTTALPVLLSTNPILSFSSNSGFGDKIAGDGDGGSVPISDINIQAYPINNTGTHLNTGLLEYHDGSEPDWVGYPAIIVYGAESNTTFYGWSIKSESGAEFSLNSLDFHDWGNYNGADFTVEAYKDGASKATYDFAGNTDGSYVSLSNPGNLPTEFSDVDEIRIYQADGADSYIAINNIGVGTPVPALPNSAPVATAPSAPTVNEDETNVALADNIQVNDADGDNQSVIFTVTGGTVSLGTSGISFSSGTNGSANFTASGSLADINAALDAATFTPAPNLYGTNAGTISFVSNDGTANSNNASVTFAIAGVNDDPTITGLPSSVTVTEDSTEDPFNISAATISDIDAESGQLTLKLEATGGVFDIATGTGITISGHLTGLLTLTGNLTDLNNYINVPTNVYFRPDANLSGTGAASVNVSINDNGNTGSGGGTDIFISSVSINITPVNDAPEAVDDNYDVDENTPQTGNVLANDSDPEGNTLTASLVTAPVNGTIVLNADGSFTYTPNDDYSGPDSVVYQVCDNGTPSLCDTATVYFDVLETVNNSPVVSNTEGHVFWREGNPPTILKPFIVVSDPDGDNITKAILTNLSSVAGDELSVASPGPYSIDYNTSTGVLTLTGTGTAAEMQAALRTVIFRNFTDDPGLGNTRNTRIVSVFVEDENGATSDAVPNPGIFVTSINDAPSVTLPASISIMEDESSPLTAISFTDADAGSLPVTVLFTVDSGTLSADSGAGVTVGGSPTSLLLEGSIADINAYVALENLEFTTDENATSEVQLNIDINDNGNTGNGGALSDQADVTLTVTAVNDAPVNTVPGTQQTDQDAALVFSSGNGNLISVSDVDAGSNEMQVTLTATNGLVSLSGTAGLSFSVGSGVNDGTMMFVGTIDDINTALNGVIFSPNAGYNGLASLTISSNDQGFSGSGGALTDTDVVSITVNSVNPIVTLVTSSAVNGPYKVGDELSISVNFDQAVTVNTTGGRPFLTLETGSTDREADYVSGSGSNVLIFDYTVQQGDVSSDLDYTAPNAFVLNGASIENISGDAAIISLPPAGSTNSLSGQKEIMIDGVIPTVTNVSVPASGTYSSGQNLDFTVNLSEAVVVNGSPQISITIGASTVQASYVSGSGTSALVFRYTVLPDDQDNDGIAVGSLSLNSGTVRDAAGNNANLTLNSVEATDQVLVDAVAPSGYSVSFELGTQSIINTVNVGTIAFEGSALEIGSTLSYEFSSSTSGTPITGTASVNSETQIFDNAGAGYDLTSLGDGTITLAISLTDDAGNVGPDVTTTVTKDATAPAGYSVTWDDALINAAESSNTSFTLANAEVNTTVDYSISSSGDGGIATITGSLPINSSAQQIPVDVSTLSDGILTLEVILTDTGNNEGAAVTASNATLDQTPPTSPSTPDLTDASDTGVSNTDNITADNTPTFTGTAEANASVEVFGDGSSLGTTAADGSGIWSFTSSSFADGTYAITATATDAAGNISSPSAALSITIDQNECNAQADFIISPTEGCTSPLTVFFTDQSTSPDVWAWDFGDGSSSSAQNPIHSYTAYGEFTVKLTVTDTVYGCSSTIEKVVSNYELSPEFTSNTTFGCGPLTVDFEDLSVGAESWDWDFGDGNTSTDQNPSHIYENPGVYAVALTTTGGSCSKTITKTNYIQVIGPDVDFSSDITEGCGPLTVAFTNSTIGSAPIIGWAWDFGDGATSTQQNPTHEYASAGTYTVKLTVNDLDGCSRTLTKTDLIQVNVLEASIIPSNVTCNGGSDGSLTATPDEGLAPFTYQWNNGASTETINGLSAGNYSVIITDANGCSVTKSVVLTEPTPAALATSNPTSVSHSSAELGGELLNGLDCAQETGIVYATTSNPDISDSKVTMTLTGNLFSEVVTGLQVNTAYYVRAYSTNLNGITTYGNEVTFTTSKKTLEITAVAGQNKIYGEADPIFTYTASGFEGGDDESILTGTLTRAVGENVGFYPIQQGTLDAGANYTIDFTGADFEIIPAA
ncbi:PKD domain-containing protein, partial [Algoriphagus resistens]|uniref:PKD domain-containing protein n=1 Tax=Algoriphagus resistens TaxID=1750590 RepID=UPI0012FB475D